MSSISAPPPADAKLSAPAADESKRGYTPEPVEIEETGDRPTVERGSSWKTTRKFFSAYAQTWVGMTPIWLLGEAIMPGQKVGGTFKKGARKLQAAATEIQQAVTISAQDVVVILDERMRSTKAASSVEMTKATEVIKAAGANAILVVTSSIEKAQAELEAHKELSPQLKKAIARNGRDVVVILDKALKNPVVVTGITKFAKAQGIPHADAMLRVASFGLSKILASMPEDPDYGSPAEDSKGKGKDKKGKGKVDTTPAVVQELDAAELERASSKEAKAEAERIGKSGEGPAPQVESGTADPYAKMRQDNKCIIM